jgi:Bacterial regulatory proteins, lacI family
MCGYVTANSSAAMKSIGLVEIAKLANVSLGTVDRAIHNRGRVSENTRKRVLAHLIYDVRKHHISVFVFQERSLRLPGRLNENSFTPKNVSFNMETWSQGGLRYFVIGDASASDIDSLAKLFKADAS